jgi:NAD(P)H-hydrate epimerase
VTRWPTVPCGEIPVLSADQMREVDRIMVEEIGIDLTKMMEHAGRSLAEVARGEAGWKSSLSTVVLAGGGNNGGGGLVAARNLHNWGARVTVVLDRSADAIRGVPREQLGILERIGVEIAEQPPEDTGVVVDALIGYGVRGDPVGRTADLIRWANAVDRPVISLDGPSGLDLTTGLPGNPSVRASVTVTLALPKRGLLSETARGFVGRVLVADIGVPPEVYEKIGLEVINPFVSASILALALPK